MRNFSKDDILDMDFKAYLASSSDENSDREIEEETEDKKENQDSKIAKYKVLTSVTWEQTALTECQHFSVTSYMVMYFPR
jgi:hypothetical protein